MQDEALQDEKGEDSYLNVEALAGTTEMSFAASNFGVHDILTIHNYEYKWRNTRTRDGVSVWQCTKTGCKARAETKGGQIVMAQNHRHYPKQFAAERRQLRNTIKAAASCSNAGDSQTIVAAALGVSGTFNFQYAIYFMIRAMISWLN